MFWGFLKALLILVEVVVSFLLIGVILIQRSKSQGVGMAFGAGVGETLFGAGVGNVLTKATVILGVVFLVNTHMLMLLPSSWQSVTEREGGLQQLPATRGGSATTPNAGASALPPPAMPPETGAGGAGSERVGLPASGDLPPIEAVPLPVDGAATPDGGGAPLPEAAPALPAPEPAPSPGP